MRLYVGWYRIAHPDTRLRRRWPRKFLPATIGLPTAGLAESQTLLAIPPRARKRAEVVAVREGETPNCVDMTL